MMTTLLVSLLFWCSLCVCVYLNVCSISFFETTFNLTSNSALYFFVCMIDLERKKNKDFWELSSLPFFNFVLLVLRRMSFFHILESYAYDFKLYCFLSWIICLFIYYHYHFFFLELEWLSQIFTFFFSSFFQELNIGVLYSVNDSIDNFQEKYCMVLSISLDKNKNTGQSLKDSGKATNTTSRKTY